MREYAESGKKKRLGPQEPPEAEVRAHASSSTTRCSRRRAACARSADQPRPEERTLHVDHDHETGAIRGLLCFTCNNALGDFRDSSDLFHAAAEYLDRDDELTALARRTRAGARLGLTAGRRTLGHRR